MLLADVLRGGAAPPHAEAVPLDVRRRQAHQGRRVLGGALQQVQQPLKGAHTHAHLRRRIGNQFYTCLYSQVLCLGDLNQVKAEKKKLQDKYYHFLLNEKCLHLRAAQRRVQHGRQQVLCAWGQVLLGQPQGGRRLAHPQQDVLVGQQVLLRAGRVLFIVVYIVLRKLRLLP